MLKIAVGPDGTVETGEGVNHAILINRAGGGAYDNWVRAIYWPDRRALYFRYWSPDGFYDSSDEEANVRALDRCFMAMEGLKRKKVIPRRVKVFYWDREGLYKIGVPMGEVLR